MNQILNSSTEKLVKRLSDSKVFLTRCCKIKSDEGGYDIIFQQLENNIWITNNAICSPLYSFHVTESDKRIQLSLEF